MVLALQKLWPNVEGKVGAAPGIIYIADNVAIILTKLFKMSSKFEILGENDDNIFKK